jgi:FlaA1/EpsC-like NDP-sugar epimerase
MTAPKKRRLYIIGAGFAGQTLAEEIRAKKIFGEVVAFLDDDGDKIGKKIGGIPVLGPIRDVAELLRMNPADEAIIAMPSVSREYLTELYLVLKQAGFERIQILPGISQIIEGEAHLIQTRSIDPQDLLGRTPVMVNLKQSLAYLRGKRVLVTGAGGSIGSELCRQLLSGGAERLFLFGHGENSIYQIDKELRLLQEEGIGEKASIVPIIGDLKDSDYTDYIIGKLKAEVIFHTAAYKHVPLMEENPVAAIENNFFGTMNLAAAARKHNIKRFVLITTDKAVEPVSVYGVSKYLCEQVVLAASRHNLQGTPGAGETADAGGSNTNRNSNAVHYDSNTINSITTLNSNTVKNSDSVDSPDVNFMVVRFGNVLGSRGSIMPLFQKQIEKGGPVTVTDEEMRRFFMTIPEACSLVLKAGGVGSNGTLYLLDMGEPVKIRDMAEQMIRFYGFEPGRDIPIEYIGRRPGERLDEPLWARDEKPVKTEYKRILRVEREIPPALDLAALTAALRPIVTFDPASPETYRDAALLRRVLKSHIPSLVVSDHER